jgi:cytochrome bd-type quinol oxidase subunit 2
MSAQPEGPAPGTTGRGFGRLLVTVYGILAFAALGRSTYQVATKLAEAPAAYLLSLLAAVVYVVATLALARGGRGRWRAVAWCAVVVEATGVVVVGVVSLVAPELFVEHTVWSSFGQGYGYVPLLLPFVGLWWLWHTRPGRPRTVTAPDESTEAR